jgi:cell division septum initiation protein DivIVA
MTDKIDINEYHKVVEENATLKKTIEELEERLKTYTNNHRHKKYYEKNKDTIKEKAKEYTQRMKLENPEKVKEWSHNAYLNQKAKKTQQVSQSIV